MFSHKFDYFELINLISVLFILLIKISFGNEYIKKIKNIFNNLIR